MRRIFDQGFEQNGVVTVVGGQNQVVAVSIGGGKLGSGGGLADAVVQVETNGFPFGLFRQSRQYKAQTFQRSFFDSTPIVKQLAGDYGETGLVGPEVSASKSFWRRAKRWSKGLGIGIGLTMRWAG